MFCYNCGAEIPTGYTACRECFTPIRRRGLLSRLFGWLGGGVKVRRGTATLVHKTEHIEVVDPETGERKVYRTTRELPADVRARIEAARAHSESAGAWHTFTFRDPSGREHTYHSVEEMPPDVRAMFEQVQGEIDKER